ncbi:hypothetical protein SMSP2_00080 [Limihaloglobus sulfuriphilus]|uniref:DUF642 domain-containing protein n=1 Tax=Limihaloglobus sulfuriphilus TaxID=1851148 RepID=A0A1Q2MAN7_9BACT|nr:choice-of-anchor C family protein [Limihaloglobus sulfuriphilus]AQQ69746.1 hypothetical protein SMSP2_00080 [Limihaloglobus sulfuriphilus]
MCKTIITTMMVLVMSVNANLIVNGGFEQPELTETAYLLSGSDIPGWTISEGYSVDLIYQDWAPASGDQSLALNGLDPGVISQQIATIPQAIYELTFMYAGNPEVVGGIVKTIVTAAGVSQQFDFDTTGYTRANMGWTQQVMNFSATEEVTTISFQSLIPGADSPAFDDVAVEMVQIPEPATMLLLAIGGIFAARKK